MCAAAIITKPSKPNERAIAADRVYLANEGAINFHTLSRIHNLHLKIYASLFLGQFKSAMEAAEEMIATTPEELLRIENPAMADWMEAYIGMKAHILFASVNGRKSSMNRCHTIPTFTA